MAEEHSKTETPVADEVKDRGLFDFGTKKEEKPQEEAKIASEFEEKVQVSESDQPKAAEEVKEEEKSRGILDKLHRSNSSSSSSSDEEGADEEKKKKKKEKGLKDKLKEKISGEKKEGEEEKKHVESTAVPVDVVHTETPLEAEEKKGFLDKIKEKLPGGTKKTEEATSPPPAPAPAPTPTPAAAPVESETAAHEGEGKEKKGFLEKIKEKLPGYNSKAEESPKAEDE